MTPAIADLFPGSGINQFTVYQLQYQWWQIWCARLREHQRLLEESRRGQK